MTQKLHVVKTDIGNDGQVWLDDIRAIQPTAHAYFNDRYVYLGFGEIVKGQCRCQFEEGRGQGLKKIPFVFHERYDFFFRYHFAVYSDAFPEIGQVG